MIHALMSGPERKAWEPMMDTESLTKALARSFFFFSAGVNSFLPFAVMSSSGSLAFCLAIGDSTMESFVPVIDDMRFKRSSCEGNEDTPVSSITGKVTRRLGTVRLSTSD